MSVLVAVTAELEGVECKPWELASALALAEQMDASPNASLHKELRQLMQELVSSKPVESGDVADDLAAKRAERRRASGS